MSVARCRLFWAPVEISRKPVLPPPSLLKERPAGPVTRGGSSGSDLLWAGAGIAEFVMKPLLSREMTETVRRVLDRTKLAEDVRCTPHDRVGLRLTLSFHSRDPGPFRIHPLQGNAGLTLFNGQTVFCPEPGKPVDQVRTAVSTRQPINVSMVLGPCGNLRIPVRLPSANIPIGNRFSARTAVGNTSHASDKRSDRHPYSFKDSHGSLEAGFKTG